MANTLFLQLEGPMQSWGERARWSVRDTAPEPTKSGVVGLLACALGLNNDNDLQNLSQKIRVGVRCDRSGMLMVDYQTVVGGVLSAEGKVKKNAATHKPETVVSWRQYLCDASFLVAVQSGPDVIAQLSEAVRNPHWPIFLGRKSCPPSLPVYAGVGDFGSLESALESLPIRRLERESPIVQVRGVIECSPTHENATRRRDEVDSRSRRTFRPRYTRDQLLSVPVVLEDV